MAEILDEFLVEGIELEELKKLGFQCHCGEEFNWEDFLNGKETECPRGYGLYSSLVSEITNIIDHFNFKTYENRVKIMKAIIMFKNFLDN